MADETEKIADPLDYGWCRYDGTRLRFRGPLCCLDRPYVAVLGGTETFGRYVEHPYPSLLSDWLGTQVLNLGVSQAGLSLFAQERWLLDAAAQAEVTVLQVLGAQNMSNRLYSVHTRRNDRFLAVSPPLREMFPDVDFSEINFTGHLLTTLHSRSPAAFDAVVQELKWAWVQRMRRIVQTIGTKVILLWMSDRRPEEPGRLSDGIEPAFVDRAMLDALTPDIAGLVEVVAEDTSPRARMVGKLFRAVETDAALALPGGAQHSAAAERLAEEIARVRNSPGPRQTRTRSTA
ncbi:hypothetical protein EF888_00455 [Silicimonas algicola]|uniref:DUF6473 domain-containing protein n=1 Tax=Silicimonas algicola TaxID=1826607 RepID=A0A316G7S3_9RHOB|nr:DUF6473 family protein [Silicimonas algicola]AZQ65734.1 hypothetical protein EF888_00455 [Silicimonas algicola]PWK56682.1 hypothetical protein C8D95_104356 [Silicimonas algicola]